jgi:phosphoribosylamine--glycine ligase
MLDTPLGEVLYAVASGTLGAQPPLRWKPGAAVTVVVAAAGYPDDPRTGDEIAGIENVAGVEVLHAGTALTDGRLVTSGGRILSVTAVGSDLSAARQSAYAAIDKISIAGSHHRTDIAAKAAAGEKS